MNRLAALYQPTLHAVAATTPCPTQRRGCAAQAFSQRGRQQRPQREREHILRGHLVDLQSFLERQGLSLPDLASRLHLCARTLRHWRHGFRAGTLAACSLGRPLLRGSRQDRNAVIELLNDLGPLTPVVTLQACFPAMSRAELTEIAQRYRRVWRLRHVQHQHVLRWPIPGAVWAIDFAAPPQPIDGLYPYLLAVRDLASGQQLLWLPVMHPDAEQTIAALASLFGTWGAPLVLKSDNGSPFCADLTQDFLGTWGVIPLYSPPYTPEYNGSIEAGISSLKTRTECEATDNGRPGAWTYDDVAAGSAQANATARPRGADGPTADDLWHTRPKLTAAQRAAFQAAVDQQRDFVRGADDWPAVGPLTERAARALDRHAIRRALVEHGYLVFRRRRIPLPFPEPKTARFR